MNTNCIILLSAAVILSSLNPKLSNALAQSTAFTYQGRLHDGASAGNGNYDLTFALFDAPIGGIQQGGTLTNAATPVSNGLFTVTLDLGNQYPGAERWLEIAVRPYGGPAAYQVLSPRQPITATPYAIRAANFSGAVAASQLTGTISSNNIAAGSITAQMLAAGSVGSNHLAAGAVTTAAIANGAVTAAKMDNVTVPVTLAAFANPTPAEGDSFGFSLAAVGSDRVLIGAYADEAGSVGAGTAYLFDASGSLLTTFTNPTPAIFDQFGFAVAALGSDRVIIGARYDNTGETDAGAAYLFSTNGVLLTTFTNPTPGDADEFGYSVAAVGSDRVLIGAYRDDTGATDAGAVYLFATNGALVTTFTNPTPANLDWFGYSVAAVGSDRILVGALYDDTVASDAGAAYLFSTNGTLLRTFTNPSTAGGGFFGLALTAVADDRVLVTAPFDDTGANIAGVAHLFHVNGALLTTFTNPAPATGDEFGRSVAAVGIDRLLIGAWRDNTGGWDAGFAYLFGTNGSLLATFTNPAGAAGDFFGYGLAAVGDDRFLIGASQNDTGATNAGAAFLLSLDTFTPGLVAEGVRFAGVASSNIAPGAVTTAALADHVVTAQKLTAATNWFALTILNPTPNSGDFLGSAVATVGSSHLLAGAFGSDIGAAAAGAALLFDMNGALVTTFTNPTPAVSDQFGRSLATVGSDRVLIGAFGDDTGATDAGAAYLFSTNGVLVTTFTNPTPANNDWFGLSLAAMGKDHFLIGANHDNTGAPESGAAYLYSAGGALLTTFTNPAPGGADQFGYSLAAVAHDRVLVGAPFDDVGAPNAGAAYLFNTNGLLLATFTNPAPDLGDGFGISVAAVGSNFVLIGAYLDDTGALNAGAAYLFNTNGTLLTTFANPTPATNDQFGAWLTAVGDDRALISAYSDSTGAANAGAAYLFSIDGVLLATFTNPEPAAEDYFGNSVAAWGDNRVLVGAYGDDTNGSNAGAVYLFGVETFVPGLVADTVRSDSVTSANLVVGSVTSSKLADGAVQADKLADGAVTPAKLDPAIGVWNRSGNNVFRSSGNVGVGTGSPQAALHLRAPDGSQLRLQDSTLNRFWSIYTESFNSSGNLLFVNDLGIGAWLRRSDGVFIDGSDARLKRDIVPLGRVLDRVLKLRPVSYRLRNAPPDAPLTLGLIAQEVEPLFPEVLDEHQGMKGLAYSQFVSVTLGAIQELNQKLEETCAELKRRDAENAELRARLEKLELWMADKHGHAR